MRNIGNEYENNVCIDWFIYMNAMSMYNILYMVYMA